MKPKNKAQQRNIAAEHFNEGLAALRRHPMFEPLMMSIFPARHEGNLCPLDGWAVVTEAGTIHVHPTRRADPDQWIYILAHSLLHLGFGHFQKRENQVAWNAACDLFVARFLADLKLGRPPQELEYRPVFTAQNEEQLYRQFCAEGIPPEAKDFRLSGSAPLDMINTPSAPDVYRYQSKPDWQGRFAQGLSAAVAAAVNVVSGVQETLDIYDTKPTPAHMARSWFISSFPLLGALAASFKIIEDAPLCARLGISIAAVDAEIREVYLNPNAGLNQAECRFVIAHELLHVGLSHHTRCQGRDPYLWNVACDYVINGWLVEMGVGDLPRLGALYDPELKNESAEAIYDRIVTDIRRYRKLATLRGIGVGDMLGGRIPDWWKTGEGLSLDEFYRRCLAQGLTYHGQQGRGFLPAGLVEEIQAMAQPPIPWDVELAKWFDDYFAPLEKMRSYARLSRRQSATPDIPRPRWVPVPGAEDGRTFGVVLDTSGSMERALLAKALGAIASYSLAHDVAAVRVVFCDAAPYDQGYMPPEAIAQRVKIRGRGGTVLQPAIDLLERAGDFPKEGPLLIITDGLCDRVRIGRDHAFLIPEGRSLPFVPKGRVFRISPT
jgi:predicted metal-dependent peptidase